ncbi:YutD family protein [Texcoconibacillus texcoconensis]|uniref:Uncharacterized protein YutD n=1 Tax=Texcoconibacillus texcoconensis TaxID=1095777 RepID=A0A840QQC1_9BACI|nr:YutD family protein [Texcoconibacillus texcoconensis]MBB5173538.1 uncharacterized protein YutD [Texcoconibacillus texcoconensis]
MIQIQGNEYELIDDQKEGWDEEAFRARFTEVLKKYDYIVGDWGYSQLRLKGFFDNESRRSSHETRISSLPEYLYEYCNFGCAYFVIKKVKSDKNST